MDDIVLNVKRNVRELVTDEFHEKTTAEKAWLMAGDTIEPFRAFVRETCYDGLLVDVGLIDRLVADEVFVEELMMELTFATADELGMGVENCECGAKRGEGDCPECEEDRDFVTMSPAEFHEKWKPFHTTTAH
jgi:hypothetical protein